MWTAAQLSSIDKMLNPRSIAVIGASAKGGYGGRLLNAVLRARDRVRVYPVNPNYDEIAGIKAYRSISDLPEAPDLMGVVVPYQKVMDVLREGHAKGNRAAVVISAGFAERGTDAGQDLQRKLGAYARESGLRVAGPNCLGLANVRDDVWATASSRTLGGLTGHIALVCQSGATAFGPFLLRAVDSGIGLSHIISTGNETDLDFSDFARYLVDDPGTRVIAGFVEGFKDVRKFIAVAELAADRGKPIVLIKIGRSESGSQAARSHTAALTGADELYDAAFKQYGVIRVTDYDELLEVSQLLANSKKPAKRGVAVVSHSGGISSLTADMLGRAGLTLPALSDRARDGINAILKDFGWAANPADVTGFARKDELVDIMNYMIDEPEVGTLVVASAGAGNQPQHVVELRDRTDKNVAFFHTASRNDAKALDPLKHANIPIFYTPDALARGLKYLVDYHAWRDARETRGVARAATIEPQQQAALEKVRGRGPLSESESKQLVSAWGVPVTREVSVQSAGGAVEAARRLGYPVAMKIDSPDILHKTEAGAVKLRLADDEAVRAAYKGGTGGLRGDRREREALRARRGDQRRIGAGDGDRRRRDDRRREVRPAAGSDARLRQRRRNGRSVRRRRDPPLPDRARRSAGHDRRNQRREAPQRLPRQTRGGRRSARRRAGARLADGGAARRTACRARHQSADRSAERTRRQSRRRAGGAAFELTYKATAPVRA
jgi:acetate---CoA ligase (ADP-forming)